MAPRTRGKAQAKVEVAPDPPVAADVDGDNVFAQLAKQHWLKPKKSAKVKVAPAVLKNEIWDVLEQESFAFKSLLALENLQILERYAPRIQALN